MARFLVALLALLIAPLASAQSGMWGSRGISERFVVAGDRVYAADGRGVSIYRAAGSSIERLHVAPSDSRTVDLAVEGNALFVATAHGLEHYAIGANGVPVHREDLPIAGGASRVAASSRFVVAASGSKLSVFERTSSGLVLHRDDIAFRSTVLALIFVEGFLYAGVEDEGIYVYDLTRDAAVANVAANAYGFALQGRVLWSAAGPVGLISIDVTSPSAPRVMGNSGGGELNVTGVAVTGSRAYAIQRPNRLIVFDITAPSSPRQISSVETPANVIAASGGNVYIAGSIVDAFGLETGTGVPMRVLNAASLQTVAEFKDLAGPVSGAATDGSLAYVVDPPYFRVIDVSTTSRPRELASIVIPRIQDRIRIKRGLAIVYGRGPVNLVDISNPYKPRHLGTYDSLGLPPSNAGLARDTFVEANYASGMHVVDYSVPDQPVQIAGRIWHYLDLLTSDDVIYAFLQNTMLVADLTDRNRVVDVVESDIGVVQAELAPASAPRPTHLLVRTPSAVHVFSLVEDRFHPAEVSVLRTNAGLMGTTDRTAYLDMNGFLSAIDLRNPFAITTTDRRVTAPMQIAGSGEKLVVADRYALRIYGPNTKAPEPEQAGRRRTVRK